jgi:hypothetical protein
VCFGGSSDPFITYLKSFGYNPIRLPRVNFTPLSVMSKSGKELTWLGSVTDLFISPAWTVPPAVTLNQPSSSIAGQRSGDLSLGVGISILGGLIAALGGNTLGLHTAYQSAKTITFEFPDVLNDYIAPAQLDSYLGNSDVNPASVTLSAMLDADDIYIITNVVKSSKYTIEAKDSRGISVAVDVPVLEQAIGANLKIAGTSAGNTKVNYEGKTPLVFGFQAVRLFYENGAYTAFEPQAAGTVYAKALSAAPRDNTDRLVVPGAFANVKIP